MYTILRSSMAGFDHLPREQRHALTDLPNRLALNAYLARAIRDTPGKFALLGIDIDNFKDTNDQHGHEQGDKLLLRTAKTLEAGLRREDAAPIHVSGDEFNIILNRIHSGEDVETVRDRIRHKLGEEGIKISIGGRLHRVGETAGKLINDVDQLMYEDKRGRKTERYDTPHARKAVARIAQLADHAGIKYSDLPTLLRLHNQGKF